MKQFEWLEIAEHKGKKYFKCRLCDVAILARRKAEIERHEKSDKHSCNNSSRMHATELHLVAKDDWELVGSQFIAKYQSLGIPLHLMEKLYNPHMRELAKLVYSRSKSLRSLTIHARRAGDIMIECLKDHYAGKFIKLITDETSTRLQGGTYVAAVSAMTASDATPYLVNMITSTTPFNSDMLQCHITNTLDRLGIRSSQVVGLMADNCSAMKATARKLGLTSFGCIAHTLSLMCNSLLESLHPVSPCISTFHS